MRELEAFRIHLKALNRSANTVEAYTRDVRDFMDFCEENSLDFRSPSYKLIETYVASLFERGLSPKTIRRRLSSLKSFYKFLGKSLPVFQGPKMRSKLPGVLGIGDIKKVMDWKPVDEEGVLAKDIVLVLYATGMRVGELISLRGEDVDLSKGVIYVRGKGGKMRVLPIHPSIRGILMRRLRAQDPPFGMSRYKVYRLVKKAFSEAVGLRGVHPHLLRHSFATHLMDNGADLKSVQELLGHSSLTSTQIYTKVSIRKIKQEYNKVWGG